MNSESQLGSRVNTRTIACDNVAQAPQLQAIQGGAQRIATWIGHQGLHRNLRSPTDLDTARSATNLLFSIATWVFIPALNAWRPVIG